MRPAEFCHHDKILLEAQRDSLMALVLLTHMGLLFSSCTSIANKGKSSSNSVVSSVDERSQEREFLRLGVFSRSVGNIEFELEKLPAPVCELTYAVSKISFYRVVICTHCKLCSFKIGRYK